MPASIVLDFEVVNPVLQITSHVLNSTEEAFSRIEGKVEQLMKAMFRHLDRDVVARLVNDLATEGFDSTTNLVKVFRVLGLLVWVTSLVENLGV